MVVAIFVAAEQSAPYRADRRRRYRLPTPCAGSIFYLHVQREPVIGNVLDHSTSLDDGLYNAGEFWLSILQIVRPKNAPDASVTITRVTMEAGATSARHMHPVSEPI